MAKQVTFDVLAVAIAKGFDETARKIDSLGASSDRVTKSFDRQSKSAHLLSTAILAAGSAAIPVLGAAAGAAIGLGAAAGVAVTGVLGIRDAMKQGTPLGKQYQAAFKPVVSEFTQLKQLSAQGLFNGINEGVKSLKPLFPTLNRDVATFSSQMGKVIGNVGPGLVALFTRVNPLFVTMGNQLVAGSAGFEKWAKSSDSVGKFVAYVQNALPAVEQTIGSLTTTISHVAMGLEPFGSTMLTTLRLFSQAINAIPVNVLQTLLPLLAGLKIGNTFANSINNASVGLGKFAENIGKSTGIASGASGAVGKLGKVVGNLGPLGIVAGAGIGLLSVALGHGKQAAVEQTNRINDLTAAIQNNTVSQTILTQLQSQGAVSAANKLGISQKQLVDGLTQSSTKFNQISGQLKDQTARYDELDKKKKLYLATVAQEPGLNQNLTASEQKQYDMLSSQLPKLGDALSKEWDAYQAAKKAAGDMATQMGDTTLATQIQSDAVDKAAKALGTTSGAYVSAKLAADQQAESTRQATLQMQLANDAAGLLKQSLDALNGKELSVAQASTSWDQSLLSLTKSLHDNGQSVAENTDKGVANRQAVEQSVSAAQAQAQAVADATKSTTAGTRAYNANGQALLDRIAKQNGDKTATDKAKDAVYQYAQQLLGLGKIKVPPTRVDVDKAAADKKIRDFKNSLITIPGYRPTATVNANTNQALARLKDIKDHLNDLNGTTAYTYVQPIVLGQQNAANKRAAAPPHRAGGGSVTAGRPYIVGENQPEVFVPDVNGKIIPDVGKKVIPDISSGSSGNSGPVQVTSGRLEITADSQGNLQAWVRDLILDQAGFAQTMERMR